MSGTGGFDELSDITPPPGVAGMRSGGASFEQLLAQALGASAAPQAPTPPPGAGSTGPRPRDQEPLTDEQFVEAVTGGALRLLDEGGDRFSLIGTDGTGVSGLTGLGVFRDAQVSSADDESVMALFQQALIGVNAGRLLDASVLAPVLHLAGRGDRPGTWVPPLAIGPTPAFADPDLNERASGLRARTHARIPIFPQRPEPPSAADAALRDRVVRMSDERGLMGVFHGGAFVIEAPATSRLRQKVMGDRSSPSLVARFSWNEWSWVAEELDGVDLLIPDIERCLDLAARGIDAVRRKKALDYDTRMRPSFTVDTRYLESVIGARARDDAARHRADAPRRAAQEAAWAAERQRERDAESAASAVLSASLRAYAEQERQRKELLRQQKQAERDAANAQRAQRREQEEMLDKIKEANTKRIVIDNDDKGLL